MLKEQLSEIIQALPMLKVAIGLSALYLLLVLGSLFKKLHRSLPWVAMGGFVIAIVLLWDIPMGYPPQMLGMIHTQTFRFFHLIPMVGGILTLWLGFWDRENSWKPTSVMLLVFMVLGAHLLLLSAHALLFYLSIEILSIGAYLLTAQSLKRQSTEAGIKYLLFGGVASAVMIYGISLLYGVSGSLNLRALLETVFEGNGGLMGKIGVAFLTIGVLFKLAAAPMHIWAADVYQTVPSSIAAFFSTVPKVAAIVIMMRWATWVPEGDSQFWPQLLALAALASMFIGNASAFFQQSSKRLLAFSSVAHAGFLLVPVISSTGRMGSHDLPLAFYVAVYVMMNYAAFAGVQMSENHNGNDLLKGFEGRGREFPLWGAIMLIIALSLTGLPVTAGFTAKMLIFSGMWESYQQTEEGWQLALLVLGLANTVIALFYYLKIPYLMFFKEEQSPDKPNMQPALEFSLIVMGGALLIFFFKPDWLWWV